MASMHCNVIPQRPQRGTSCLSSNHSCHNSQPAAFPARNSSRVPTSHAVSPAKRTVSFQISAASSASCRTHHLQGQYLQSFGHATGLSHEQVLSRRSLHRRGRLALTALPQDALHQSLSEPNSSTAASSAPVVTAAASPPDSIRGSISDDLAPSGTSSDVQHIPEQTGQKQEEEHNLQRSTEASIQLSMPRRSMQVTFTCNLCGTRTQRKCNPVAWNKGMVMAKCGGCEKWHKLKDEGNLVDETRYIDERRDAAAAAAAAAELT